MLFIHPIALISCWFQAFLYLLSRSVTASLRSRAQLTWRTFPPESKPIMSEEFGGFNYEQHKYKTAFTLRSRLNTLVCSYPGRVNGTSLENDGDLYRHGIKFDSCSITTRRDGPARPHRSDLVRCYSTQNGALWLRSVASAYDSDPEKGTENRIGAFLVQCIFQCNAITCDMFLTSMAGNPLAANFAKEQGVEITWAGWAAAAIVPGAICLFLLPLAMYLFFPPELKKTPEMRAIARNKLAELGPMSRDELMVCFTFIGMVTLWVLGPTLGIHATITALLGLVFLLFTRTINWDAVLGEKEAWHTITWFAVLIMMAAELNKLGFIGWFSQAIGSCYQEWAGRQRWSFCYWSITTATT